MDPHIARYVEMARAPRQIGLVSCTKAKCDRAATPRELYRPSAYFRKASEYAETHHDEWYILSAEHHLLDPDGPPIEPYEKTLNTATVEEQRTWSQKVCEELWEYDCLDAETTLVFHAGKAYYEELIPLLADVSVNIPTEGLRFGETLAWYNERL